MDGAGCQLVPRGVNTMNAGFQAGAPAGDHRTKDLIATVSSIANSLMGEVSKVIIGKNENLEELLSEFYRMETCSGRFPGLAKTLLSNTFARALGCKFKRVQFTPDLLPSDIMGTYMFDQNLVNSNYVLDLCSQTFY